jgi:aldose 1-epimerase
MRLTSRFLLSCFSVCLLTSAISCGPAETENQDTDAPPAGESDQNSETTSEENKMRSNSEPYGEMPDGTKITQYFLSNGDGLTVTVINYGGIVTSVKVPDKDGNVENITLTQKDLEGWLDNAPYFGCLVGRYANRIANGKFSLDGNEYELATNNDTAHLHGGEEGFNQKVWTAELLEPTDTEVGVVLNYTSPDGEEGYPGTLKAEVKYIVTADNELRIEYNATTDKKTVVNLTNHCYWNLGGAGSGKILDHLLTLHCDKYLPVDEALIPTGELAPVEGTPMDFTEPHPIGSRIDQVEGGYDHCWVINGEPGTVRPVAKAVDPASGRVMEISSDQPGVQFYTGNFLDGSENNGGFSKNEAFCLETQVFPDSPNQPDFPSCLLEPGQVYRHVTVHKFSVGE